MDTPIRSPYRLLAACLLAALLAVVLVAGTQARSSAQAANSVVEPGESIQTAVNRADAGDTIVVRGVHREDVIIRKNGISLRGIDNAVLRAPARADSRCSRAFAPVGICLLGDVNLRTFELTGPRVKNVSVSGLEIRGFGDGIVAVGARNATYTNNEGLRNDGYGFAAFLSIGTKILSNSAHDNGFAGIYVGDSANANLKVAGNDTFRNTLGMFFRNSSRGSISGNEIHNNCAGMLFLAENPGADGNYEVRNNDVLDNARACPDPEFPVSGIGIWLAGSRGMEIVGNQISGNIPSGATVVRGGVVVASGFEGQTPRNNSIIANDFGRNRPDIFWDGSGSGNRFVNNDCNASVPARLCG